MIENPYQPPNPTSSDGSALDDPPRFDPPRYRGSLEFIQGEIDEAEAIAMATACQPIEIAPEIGKSKKRFPISTILPLLIIVAMVILILFDARWRAGPSPSSGGRFPAWINVAIFIVVPLSVLAVLTLLLRRLRFRYDKSDPPLGGRTLVKLNPLGCSIEKTTRDDRPIEVFCSWRQAQLTESADAWLLNIGMVNPFLIAKSWIAEESEKARFDDLKMEIARWQSEQQPQFNLESIPEIASESFPDYRAGATAFTVSSVTEKAARKSVAGQLRKDLPEYRNTPFSLAKLFWQLFLAAVVSLLVYVILRTDWSELNTNFWTILWQVIPLLVVIAIGLRVTFLVRREITVAAAISDENLWYDYRSLLLRLPLKSLPFRRLVAGNLVLGTPTGSTTIVLHPSHFESPEAFREIADRLIDQR